jgi:hypothetical protein
MLESTEIPFVLVVANPNTRRCKLYLETLMDDDGKIYMDAILDYKSIGKALEVGRGVGLLGELLMAGYLLTLNS